MAPRPVDDSTPARPADGWIRPRPADDSTRALARELFGIADRIDGMTDDPRMRTESAALRTAALLAAERVLAR